MKNIKRFVGGLGLVLFANLLLACSAMPQEQDLATMANEAYVAEDWKKAENLYTRFVEENPTSGRGWYRLAVAQRYLEKFTQALQSLDKATEVGVGANHTDYERAKVAATQGQNKLAITLLQSAATAGLAGKQFVLGNEHLAALAEEPGFKEVLDQLEVNANPCSNAKFREFDFWIGTWDVVQANGQNAGRNKIVAREQNCMLQEEWTSASGNTGISMNFYDGAAGEWVQQWISPGIQLRIAGGLKDGSMVLEGKVHYTRQGNTAPFRGTWTLLEDGRIRQFFQQADDEGNWTPWFEGFYTKVEDSD